MQKVVGELSFLFVSILSTGAASAAAQEPADGGVVVHWNAIAFEVLAVDPGPILDARGLAIVQASVHDALNGIVRRYQPYTADLSSPGASVAAAVAAAAHEVLVPLSPSQRAKIEEAYAAALARIPDGPAKEAGIVLGQQSGQANLARRVGDGIEDVNNPVYVPTGKPGDYDFTPPFDRPPLGPIAFFPGFGRVTPFAIDIAAYPAPGPDSLDSARYADDLNYLKSIGKLKSPTRTADQTEMAFFWFEGVEIFNQIAGTVLRQRGVDAWSAARILALMNFAVVDAGIDIFDAKYEFRFWRPYTAIRRADEDGNHGTEPDDEWLPLLWTPIDVIPPPFFIPPIPEYPSAAAIISAAAAEVLILNLGDNQHFEATSPYLPGVTRRFDSFTQAASEARWSRVYGGIHFVKAIADGQHMGKSIGAAVSLLLPPVER
jgi:hypothetical protein